MAARHALHRLSLAGNRLLAKPAEPAGRLGLGARRLWRRLHRCADRRACGRNERHRLAQAGNVGRDSPAAGSRRLAAPYGLDPANRCSRHGKPAARQRAAKPEVGSETPAAVDRHIFAPGQGAPGNAHRVARNRAAPLLQRGAARGVARPDAPWRCLDRRRHKHHRRRLCQRRGHADTGTRGKRLRQTPPGALRRISTAGLCLVLPLCADSDVGFHRRRCAAGSAALQRPAYRAEHLLRGSVRRRIARCPAGSDIAGESVQHGVVRRFAGAAATSADRPVARH